MKSIGRERLERIIKNNPPTPLELLVALFKDLRDTFEAHCSSSHLVLYYEAALAIDFASKKNIPNFSTYKELIAYLDDWRQKVEDALNVKWVEYNRNIQPQDRKNQLSRWTLSWARRPYKKLPELISDSITTISLHDNREKISELLDERQPVKRFGIFASMQLRNTFTLDEIIPSEVTIDNSDDTTLREVTYQN